LHYLTQLRMSVGHRNSLNLQDVNVHAEAFFRDFLNLVFEYKLKNINIVERNARAIDLGDEDRHPGDVDVGVGQDQAHP